jgi:AcrR family transcriptional regulator
MARMTPPDRVEKLLGAAAAAFVENGFHRTQMDDVANRLGVSKGTIYRSVDSKEALFAAVLEHGDTPEDLPEHAQIDPDRLDQVSKTLRNDLSIAVTNLQLAAAVAQPAKQTSATDFGTTIERLTVGVYEMMAKHRIRIMVLDRCAAELPELAGDWYEQGRYALVDLWSRYLTQHDKYVDASVDHEVLARTIVELTTLWAVKIAWDPAPRPYPTDMARSCAAMVHNLTTGRHT